MALGQTPAEAVLRELREEAGLHGRVTRLLGVFDGRLWDSPSKVDPVHLVFAAACDDFDPVPGSEMLDARFFRPIGCPRRCTRDTTAACRW